MTPGKHARAAATIGFWILCCGLLAASAAEKSSEALEQEYKKETNPRKQADIARKLIDQRLEQLRARSGTGIMLDESSPELAHYQSAIEMLGAAVRESSHTGTAKNAEKKLRDQAQELDDLRVAVSAGERPLLTRLLSQVAELRKEILYSLMLPPQESKKGSAEKEESAQQ